MIQRMGRGVMSGAMALCVICGTQYPTEEAIALTGPAAFTIAERDIAEAQVARWRVALEPPPMSPKRRRGEAV